MMILLITKLCVFIFVLILITFPFLGEEKERFSEDYEKSKIFDLLSQKDIVLQGLLDLEYDYEMEKLSNADYENLKIEMKNEAAVIFKEIDKVNEKS